MRRLVCRSLALVALASGCIDAPVMPTPSAPAAPSRSVAGALTGTPLAAQLGIAWAINERDEAVGYISTGGSFAATWSPEGAMTLLPAPWNVESVLRAINESGASGGAGWESTVGGYVHTPMIRAADGSTRWLDMGGASIVALNDAGEAAIFCFWCGDQSYYWSEATGPMRLANPAGGVRNFAMGIASDGTIVGYSSDDVRLHAVAWSSRGAEVRDLGALEGDWSLANDVNDHGVVVGLSRRADGVDRAVRWVSGTIEDLSAWPGSCAGRSVAQAVNASGIIVGECGGRPVVWREGAGMAYLDDDAGAAGEAYDINDRGTVVGRLWGRPWRWTIPVNTAPVVAAGGEYAAAEGGSIALTLSATDADGDALSFRWDLGDGTTGSGPVPPAAHSYVNDGTFTITLTADDGRGGTATASARAVIANVAPVVGQISAPAMAVAVGTPVEISAAFTDAGVADVHSAEFRWDVGASSESTTGRVTEERGSGIASGTHVYAVPGIYTVAVAVRDEHDEGAAEYRYVVVYDPSAGFVTGGGWFDAPADACAATECASAAGDRRVHVTVNARYTAGDPVPTGKLLVRFGTGGRLASAGLDWLVVRDGTAQLSGGGTIDGVPGYGILVAVRDAGGRDPDLVRVRVWEVGTGRVVFDSQRGQGLEAPAATLLGGGNVTVH